MLSALTSPEKLILYYKNTPLPVYFAYIMVGSLGDQFMCDKDIQWPQ